MTQSNYCIITAKQGPLVKREHRIHFGEGISRSESYNRIKTYLEGTGVKLTCSFR